jgi:hypothetical protein
MSDHLTIKFGNEWQIHYEATGSGKRIQWVVQRCIEVGGDFAWTNVEAGRSGNPKAAKEAAEAALSRAQDQTRVESRVMKELRGYYNQ